MGLSTARNLTIPISEEEQSEPDVGGRRRADDLGDTRVGAPLPSSAGSGGGDPPQPPCSRPWCYGVATHGGLCASCFEAEPRVGQEPCVVCSRPRGYSDDPDGLCTPCAEKVGQRVAQVCLEDQVASILRQFEDSPHRCRGGCGSHMLAADQECSDCGARRKDMEDRGSCAGAYHTPKRYHWARFDAPELQRRVMVPAQIATARAACVDGTTLIVFVGPAGVGKTSLAFAAARQLAYNRKVQIRYEAAPLLALARVQAPLGDEAPSVADAIAARLLVLDDVGVDPNVPTSPVTDVIYARYHDSRTTIITTSLDHASAAQRYGDGIARRIFEQVEGTYIIDLRVRR